MPKKSEKHSIGDSLDKLEKIIAWFDDQEQVQVEEGLTRVKEGSVLVKELRSRLKEVENDFKEVKKDLEGE